MLYIIEQPVLLNHCNILICLTFCYDMATSIISDANMLPYPVHYITLHYITLHYITLHYITLHYITLHYITLTTYKALIL